MAIRSKKITQSARNQDCTLRLPGICNFNPETTVFAHIGTNRGMGFKCSDVVGVYACSNCHSEIDGVNRHALAADKLRALEETLGILISNALVKVA